MKRIFAALLLGVAALGAPTMYGKAYGAECDTTSAMRMRLASEFNEQPRSMGSIGKDRYMQLFRSSKGTWTIVITDIRNVSCIIAGGNDWEDLPEPQKMAEQTF